MTAIISGIGWVTAAGMGRGQDHQSFNMPNAPLPRLTRESIFVKGSFPRFGRMDEYSKLGLGAISYALKDAMLDEWDEKRAIGIIASTVYGCLGTDFDYYNSVIPQDGLLASPNLFTYTLPNCFLGDAAISFGLTGISFIINEDKFSGLGALQMALDCISLGECDTMLVGICDLGCPTHFPLKEKTIPGSIFIVLERSPRDPCPSYGKLSMDKKGAIFFNGSEIMDIKDCVCKCLRKEICE